MGPEAHELQNVFVWFAVDEDEVGFDVAVTVIFPIPDKRVISAARLLGLVPGQGGYDRNEFKV